MNQGTRRRASIAGPCRLSRFRTRRLRLNVFKCSSSSEDLPLESCSKFLKQYRYSDDFATGSKSVDGCSVRDCTSGDSTQIGTAVLLQTAWGRQTSRRFVVTEGAPRGTAPPARCRLPSPGTRGILCLQLGPRRKPCRQVFPCQPFSPRAPADGTVGLELRPLEYLRQMLARLAGPEKQQASASIVWSASWFKAACEGRS